MIAVRLARAEDEAAALVLIEQLGYPESDHGAFRARFTGLVGEEKIFVAESEGRVVGLVTWAHRAQLRLARDVGTIDELVVADGARGEGVGRALLEAACAAAERAGCERVDLQTTRARESYARGFYVKNGFTERPTALMRRER